MLKKYSFLFKISILFGVFITFGSFATGIVLDIPSKGLNTISAGMIKARAGDTILVRNGKYKEHIFVKAGVILKARNLHKARIDGKGRGTVVTLGANSAIIGFIIQNGTIGVFSKNGGVSILKCRIANNWMTGIITVKNLPQIEDNIIAFNRASGIQGWDVRSTVSAINHNSIAFNANHGIAMGGSCNIVIENNVVAHNERFAMKISDESKKSKITNNNFYKNLKHIDKIPPGNHSFDPAFISPRTDMNFSSDPKSCCKVKTQNNENLGARFNY